MSGKANKCMVKYYALLMVLTCKFVKNSLDIYFLLFRVKTTESIMMKPCNP